MKKFTLYYESNIRNMKNIYKSLVFVFYMLVAFQTKAQDIHFSQFFEAPLLRNPSLAGIFTGDIRFQGVYRDQWGSVTIPYKTGSFNFEYKQPIGRGDDFLTTGVQMVYDKAGSTNFTTSNLLPAINYHKSLSEYGNKYLSLGFMGGLVQRRIDRSKMTTNNHFDGNGYNPGLPDGETFSNPNYTYMDGSVGMAFNSSMGDKSENNYFLGLAYHHFNRPKNSFYQNPAIELDPKWVFSAGARFDLSGNSFFTLQGDYTTQGPNTEVIGGATYSVKVGSEYDEPDYILHFGAYMRWKDAIIPVVKLDYRPFAVALSYDVNVSALKTASQGRGGMELSITYAGFFDRDNSSRNAIKCPRF
jgi:type IX secretion system PorP/SprF family membrane protein